MALDLNQLDPEDLYKITEPKEFPYLQEKETVSETMIDWDNETVLFSFENYNKRRCEIFGMQPKEVDGLTERLKVVNSVLTRHLKQGSVTNFECKRLANKQNYAVLFNDLPEGVDELLEIYYAKQGRIIGFVIKNIFYITAILRKHIKID